MPDPALQVSLALWRFKFKLKTLEVLAAAETKEYKAEWLKNVTTVVRDATGKFASKGVVIPIDPVKTAVQQAGNRTTAALAEFQRSVKALGEKIESLPASVRQAITDTLKSPQTRKVYEDFAKKTNLPPAIRRYIEQFIPPPSAAKPEGLPTAIEQLGKQIGDAIGVDLDEPAHQIGEAVKPISQKIEKSFKDYDDWVKKNSENHRDVAVGSAIGAALTLGVMNTIAMGPVVGPIATGLMMAPLIYQASKEQYAGALADLIGGEIFGQTVIKPVMDSPPAKKAIEMAGARAMSVLRKAGTIRKGEVGKEVEDLDKALDYLEFTKRKKAAKPTQAVEPGSKPDLEPAVKPIEVEPEKKVVKPSEVSKQPTTELEKKVYKAAYGRYSPKLAKAVSEFEDSIANLGHEEFAVFAPDGTSLAYASGNKNSVSLTSKQIKDLKENAGSMDMVATHNHPPPYSVPFSVPDMLVACNIQLKEIRVSSKDYIYTATKKDGSFQAGDAEVLKKSHKQALLELSKAVQGSAQLRTLLRKDPVIMDIAAQQIAVERMMQAVGADYQAIPKNLALHEQVKDYTKELRKAMAKSSLDSLVFN